RRSDRFDGFDQTGRWQYWRSGFRRFRSLLRRCALLALRKRRLRKDVTARERNVPNAREPLDELTRDDLFGRARGAFDLDAVIALQQGGDFLTGGVQKLRDLINPDCRQFSSSKKQDQNARRAE